MTYYSVLHIHYAPVGARGRYRVRGVTQCKPIAQQY